MTTARHLPSVDAGHGILHHGSARDALGRIPDDSIQLIYIDPPFNTGRVQKRRVLRTTAIDTDAAAPAEGEAADGASVVRRSGFAGREYSVVREALRSYDDSFDNYWEFLHPHILEAWRVLTPTGTLYVHLDYREAHYAKVMLDATFGRDHFLNEIIWAYDYGGKSVRRWPAKHDTILVYVKNPSTYFYDSTAVDREPYMAPGLVTPEKAERGKLPTDVWWHTIVPTSGAEKTGYPTQKPEGILRRIVTASSAPGDWVLDFFAGSGTTGAVASALGRRFVVVDENPEAVEVMRARLGSRVAQGACL